MHELVWLDALGQAALVRRGELTALELTEAAIWRIEALNGTLNAVVTPLFEQALVAARGPLPSGLLAGVPFLLKDLVATYGGARQTEGSRFLRDYIAPVDSELVRRYKQAGLIIVGKTNTPEFGNMSTTEPALFGPSPNPWALDRTSGGSSGGSAAAVAAGMTPMAHANDAGGSIRIPASCCGVFGLKPTRGRNPLGPDYGDMLAGLVTEHAVTRSVRDSAALLDATSGPSLGEPYSLPKPQTSFLHAANAEPRPLRIAWTDEAAPGIPVDEECKAAARAAAQLCADLGHSVVEAQPPVPLETTLELFYALWCDYNCWLATRWAARTGQTLDEALFEPYTWALQQEGRKRTAGDHLLTVERMHRLGREVAHFFAHYDLWLTPTLAELPVPLGTFAASPANPLAVSERDGLFTPFNPIANLTGQPAMSVPLYWSAAGLPIGVQFLGRYGDEATLFSLGAQLEAARPWAQRRPFLACN